MLFYWRSVRESNSLRNPWQGCILTIWPTDQFAICELRNVITRTFCWLSKSSVITHPFSGAYGIRIRLISSLQVKWPTLAAPRPIFNFSLFFSLRSLKTISASGLDGSRTHLCSCELRVTVGYTSRYTPRPLRIVRDSNPWPLPWQGSIVPALLTIRVSVFPDCHTQNSLLVVTQYERLYSQGELNPCFLVENQTN